MDDCVDIPEIHVSQQSYIFFSEVTVLFTHMMAISLFFSHLSFTPRLVCLGQHYLVLPLLIIHKWNHKVCILLFLNLWLKSMLIQESLLSCIAAVSSFSLLWYSSAFSTSLIHSPTDRCWMAFK